ncbi:MAG: hypothetical protein ABEL51_16345 [Salinibacter sp.]
MSAPTLYIHVGPSKTATTYLQRKVLGAIESAECLPVPHIEVQGQQFRFGDLFSFSPGFWGGLEENPFAGIVRRSDRDVVISDERIFGGLAAPEPWIPGSVPGRGLPPSPRRHTHCRFGPYWIASHLRELRRAAAGWGYERVRVLLTTRRQDTKLASSYAQLSNRVRGAGQQNFETWIRHLLHDVLGHNKGGGAKLNYALWWRQLGEAVGTDNVFFLPFERLRETPAAFLTEWLRFLEVPAPDSIVDTLSGPGHNKQNVRSQSADTWSLRTPIKKGRYLLRWPDLWRGSEIRLTDALREEILSVYAEGNRSLDEHLPHLRLDEYEYY